MYTLLQGQLHYAARHRSNRDTAPFVVVCKCAASPERARKINSRCVHHRKTSFIDIISASVPRTTPGVAGRTNSRALREPRSAQFNTIFTETRYGLLETRVSHDYCVLPTDGCCRHRAGARRDVAHQQSAGIEYPCSRAGVLPHASSDRHTCVGAVGHSVPHAVHRSLRCASVPTPQKLSCSTRAVGRFIWRRSQILLTDTRFCDLVTTVCFLGGGHAYRAPHQGQRVCARKNPAHDC